MPPPHHLKVLGGFAAVAARCAGTQGESPKAREGGLGHSPRGEGFGAERLYGLDAFEAVMPGLLYPAWDRELAEKALGFVDDFLEKVPVFRLSCRPDAESVEVLERALREL